VGEVGLSEEGVAEHHDDIEFCTNSCAVDELTRDSIAQVLNTGIAHE
jgi:hypothetical protein